MRDPYHVLGLSRGAPIEEIKAAYRRLSKQRHPDAGGSTEAMSELNVAYHAILDELKQRYKQEEQREEQERTARESENEWRTADGNASAQARREKQWRDRYREIDEELEALRRSAEAQAEHLRRMREEVWRSGAGFDWARLTVQDILAFVRSIARSGVKGLALIFSALVGIGAVLVEANVVSAIIMIGSVLGVLVSLSLKSDKGGMMSAALLLFGVMTIWLAPVRSALLTFPLATISVLVLLGLIYKFTREGGTVGMMTGGVLALYILIAIVNSTTSQPNTPIVTIPTWTPSPGVHPRPTMRPTAPPPTTPEPLTLMASDGATLKFVSGIPYHLKVRNGRATFLRATVGTVKLTSGGDGSGACVDSLHFLPNASNGPWSEIDATIRACGSDAVFSVHAVD